jgi:hypothetical protein
VALAVGLTGNAISQLVSGRRLPMPVARPGLTVDRMRLPMSQMASGMALSGTWCFITWLLLDRDTVAAILALSLPMFLIALVHEVTRKRDPRQGRRRIGELSTETR